jgi:hypothetical protein
MKKLLFAAATLVLAATTGPALLVQAQAAPATRSAECNVAAQAGSASWQEHYHCWGAQAGTVPVVNLVAPKPSTKAAECNMAAQAGNASWQEHYHCWGQK